MTSQVLFGTQPLLPKNLGVAGNATIIG